MIHDDSKLSEETRKRGGLADQVFAEAARAVMAQRPTIADILREPPSGPSIIPVPVSPERAAESAAYIRSVNASNRQQQLRYL